ncbi:MAG: hypothetical protein U9R14_01990 [Patescibacteria group bacterium]|nr:hypothetical protein [Patescibacteria group bacterium]
MLKYLTLNKFILTGIFITMLCAVFLLPNFALALDPGLKYPAQIGLGDTDPRVIIAKIIRIALGFLGIIAVGIIMYAGWLWMSSEGDEEKINQSKKILKNAIIGLIIILSAFAIVSFILNKLIGATTGSGPGEGGGPPGSGEGLGALGSCILESVYPEPNQTEVPRNTGIFITFKEEVDPSTICVDTSGDGIYCNCSGDPKVCDIIVFGNIRIFKTVQGDSCEYDGEEYINCEDFNVTNVYALSNDNKTFVFVPVDYLGSPSEYIWYSVYLSNDIKKVSGEGVFDDCRSDYFEWQFEVSNKIDLTPPQVKQAEVFPAPDNEQDDINVTTAAVQATGEITVNSQPSVDATAVVESPAPQGGSESAIVSGAYNCQQDGVITVSIAAGDPNTASVSGIAGVVSGDDVSDEIASLGCGLTLTPDDGTFEVGNSWTINVTAEKQADTLTAGDIVYTFGIDIASDADNNITAGNIADALAGHVDVTAAADNNVVQITAKVSGEEGNNIVLAASNPDALAITPMSGGQDAQETIIINDREDKPRNAVIQINFNEAINPLSVSGDADEVNNYIRVVNATSSPVVEGGVCVNDADCISFNCDSGICAGSNTYLQGKFMVSNQYSTVEFISDNICAVNACGEKIYCLPEISHLRVELMAASLADCGDDNCASRSPYNNCVDNVCQDSNGINYPMADIALLDGIVDAALNSLDGNRDEDADGPVTFYNENYPVATDGDNYQWSFYISDKIDLEPPVINLTEPNHSSLGVGLSDFIKINFNKLIMSSSLRTGSTEIFNGKDYVEHQLINLWNFTDQPLGYWITKDNIDDDPLDGEPDWTQAEIRHSMFADTAGYRAQVGSGVKDIYQNCFKPSSSAACVGSPSCCGEVPTADSSCP